MKIRVDDIKDIALGSAFLATGGGGDPMISQLATEQIMREHGEVELLPLSELKDSATVVAVGGSGAPSIMLEKMPNGMEGVWALEKLEAHLGRKADALIAFEVGGSNSLLPVMTAAIAGLPVVDGDGMGRALPEMQMVTFSIYGVSGTPMAVVDEFGDGALITARSSEKAEAMIRQLGLAMGGQCTSAEHVMDGATTRQVTVAGSISLALRIGQTLRQHRGELDQLIGQLQPELRQAGYGELRCLLQGKVTDIHRSMEGGFDLADVWIDSFDGQRQVKLAVRNEYLMVSEADKPLAMVPDLITLVDSDTAQPITAERLRYGQRVAILAIGAPELLRTERALQVVGPRQFGFDTDFIPLSELG